MPAYTIRSQVNTMAFLKKKHACDNCGKDLSDEEDELKEDGHEFCSVDCKDKYVDEHDHEDTEEENICEFC